jgi:hypothetical protein
MKRRLKEGMALKVSEEILKKTTKCGFDFQCLNNITRREE